jgi:hypothetical protein
MAFGIHQLEDRDWVFKQDVTIQGDFTFGNAATDTLTVTGDYTQTYAGTSDGFIVSGTGAQTAGKDLARFTTVGSLSSTSNVVAIEQGTGAGVSGAYGLYVNCTGTNVEGIKVDAGAVVFDETLLVTGVLTSNGNVSLGAGSDLLGSSTSDITINTNKFTVAGATGNTVVAGTLGVTGVSTLTGQVYEPNPVKQQTITDFDSQSPTLTVASMLGGVVKHTSVTGAGIATVDTGTAMSTGVSGVAVGSTIEWIYYNDGDQTATITAAAGHTLIGGTAAVTTGKWMRITSVNTASNTWESYLQTLM